MFRRGFLGDRQRAGFGAAHTPMQPMPAITSTETVPIRDAPGGVVKSLENETMLSIVLARLASLEPSAPELRARLDALKAELAPLLLAADDLEGGILDAQRESLEQQHAEIRKAGRKQQELVSRLALELQQAEPSLMNVGARQEAVQKQLHALSDLEAEGRHLGRWATDQEIAKWDERVARAKAKIDPINRECASALQVRNTALAVLDAGQKELARLGSEEQRLRHALEGTGYVDSEYGLEVKV
jgi:chromosome segregation ATPase